MRLKFLFFPIVLVISFAIFMGYIWPEIENVRNANKEMLKSKSQLEEVKKKRSAVESVGTQMAKNGEIGSAVRSYLPENKVEERIINGVNYLASDAGVALNDIAQTNSPVSEVIPASMPVDTAQTISAAAAASKSAAGGVVPESGNLSGQAIPMEADSMKYVRANIKVSGKYEDISIFLDQIHRMPVLNYVRSLNIGQQEAKADDSESTSSDALLAEVVVDFGYLKLSAPSNAKIASFEPGINDGTIKTLKEYISQRPLAPTAGGDDKKGKVNPFVLQ